MGRRAGLGLIRISSPDPCSRVHSVPTKVWKPLANPCQLFSYTQDLVKCLAHTGLDLYFWICYYPVTKVTWLSGQRCLMHKPGGLCSLLGAHVKAKERTCFTGLSSDCHPTSPTTHTTRTYTLHTHTTQCTQATPTTTTTNNTYRKCFVLLGEIWVWWDLKIVQIWVLSSGEESECSVFAICPFRRKGWGGGRGGAGQGGGG